MNRTCTPTNNEMMLKVAALLIMLLGVAAIPLAATHVSSSSIVDSILALLSLPLLFTGFEILTREPGEQAVGH